MNELIDNREIYLPFLSEDIVNGFRTNYGSFDHYVCKLGIKQIFDNFLDDIFARYYTLLNTLRERMGIQAQAKLEELEERYQQLLESLGVYEALELLRMFLSCINNGVCDYSSTAENQMQEYEEKLLLSRTGESWIIDFSSKLVKYNENKNKLDAKIDETLLLIQNRSLEGIQRADVMIF